MADGTIDRVTFDELRAAVGDDFVAELVDTFTEEAPACIAQLRAALATGDVDGYRRAAHSLKSNCATFGAHGLAAQARDVELGGFPSNADAARATIDDLESGYVAAAAALRELASG